MKLIKAVNSQTGGAGVRKYLVFFWMTDFKKCWAI